jgi:hypothetical protein
VSTARTVVFVLDSIFGLPTHILVVHAAVVLVPLAAIGAIIMGFAPTFSVRFGPAVVVIAGAGVVSSILARQSGESLALLRGVSVDHQSSGSLMPLFALGLFAVTLALWLVDRRRARRRALGTQILAVVVVAVAVLATGWTIRTGHTGSEMVWQGIYPA